MHEYIISLAKQIDAIVTGSYAAARICPRIQPGDIDLFTIRDGPFEGFNKVDTTMDTYFTTAINGIPDEIYTQTRDGVRIQIISCYLFRDVSLVDLVDEFDMDICKCWYDGDGNFHTRPAALLAAQTNRCLVRQTTTLTRVLKYRARGFDVRLMRPNLMGIHTNYDSAFEAEIIADTRVKTLCFRHMRITNSFLSRILVRHWDELSFGECDLSDVNMYVPDTRVSFSRCNFRDTYVCGIPHRACFYQNCTGNIFFRNTGDSYYLIIFDADENTNLTTHIEHRDDLYLDQDEKQTRDKIHDRERAAYITLIAKFLDETPIQYPRLASVISSSRNCVLSTEEHIRRMLRLSTRYIGVLIRALCDATRGDFSSDAVASAIEKYWTPGYKIPVEYVNVALETFTLRHLVYAKYPFFAQESHREYRPEITEFSPLLMTNNLGTFTMPHHQNEWWRNFAPLMPLVPGVYPERTWFPAGALADAIAQDGFTPGLIELVRDQLILTNCDELIEVLYTLPEIPEILCY